MNRQHPRCPRGAKTYRVPQSVRSDQERGAFFCFPCVAVLSVSWRAPLEIAPPPNRRLCPNSSILGRSIEKVRSSRSTEHDYLYRFLDSPQVRMLPSSVIICQVGNNHTVPRPKRAEGGGAESASPRSRRHVHGLMACTSTLAPLAMPYIRSDEQEHPALIRGRRLLGGRPLSSGYMC